MDRHDGQVHLVTRAAEEVAAAIANQAVTLTLTLTLPLPLTALQSFVEIELGRRFIEPPPFDLHAAFTDSSVNLPLIFILSTGADPVKGLLGYADNAGMGSRLDYISLGQGQGPKAERLIKEGKEQGRWVLLMNCHLYVSWLTQLEKEVEDIDI